MAWLMVPTRLIFRSRWWALAWAAGICWTAVSVVGDHGPLGLVNAADAPGDNAAQANALAAENNDD